ncbi:hypothetical protein BC829DRAFT_445105 [Chytridium lagenaria]|nr:hypothetical protein BC829DRAFT_445105 [Chytridium lagenaria]
MTTLHVAHPPHPYVPLLAAINSANLLGDCINHFRRKLKINDALVAPAPLHFIPCFATRPRVGRYVLTDGIELMHPYDPYSMALESAKLLSILTTTATTTPLHPPPPQTPSTPQTLLQKTRLNHEETAAIAIAAAAALLAPSADVPPSSPPPPQPRKKSSKPSQRATALAATAAAAALRETLTPEECLLSVVASELENTPKRRRKRGVEEEEEEEDPFAAIALAKRSLKIDTRKKARKTLEVMTPPPSSSKTRIFSEEDELSPSPYTSPVPTPRRTRSQRATAALVVEVEEKEEKKKKKEEEVAQKMEELDDNDAFYFEDLDPEDIEGVSSGNAMEVGDDMEGVEENDGSNPAQQRLFYLFEVSGTELAGWNS